MLIWFLGVDLVFIDLEILGFDCEWEEFEFNEFDDVEEWEYVLLDVFFEYIVWFSLDDENDIDLLLDYDLFVE